MLSALSKRIRNLFSDKALRAAAVLVGGTAGAQAIGLLALPLLTRFYTPDDFSLLAAYVAILAILAAVTCMRLDAAIPLPESNAVAANLLVLSLSCATIFTFLSGVAVYLFGASLADAFGWPTIKPYLWLVPFGIGLMGAYSSFQYMAMRQKHFKLIARTKITQAVVGFGAQLGFAVAGVLPLGLLLGHALNSGSGVVALAVRTMRASEREGGVGWQSLRHALYVYRRFPQYSVAEGVINNAGMQLPVLLIAVFLAGPEAGLLFLAMRVVGAPMTIVGGAVAQVYYAHAADFVRRGTIAFETTKVFRRLSRTLVIPLLALGPFAPDLFRIVFGPEWARAGTIVVMMLPWYACRLIASPISTVMHVCMRQQLMLIVTLAGLVIRVLPLLVAVFYAPLQATLVFAITSALFYGASLIVFLKVAGLSIFASMRLMLSEALLWLGAASTSFIVLSVMRNVKGGL